MAPEERDVELTDPDGGKWSGTVEKEDSPSNPVELTIEAVKDTLEGMIPGKE